MGFFDWFHGGRLGPRHQVGILLQSHATWDELDNRCPGLVSLGNEQETDLGFYSRQTRASMPDEGGTAPLRSE